MEDAKRYDATVVEEFGDACVARSAGSEEEGEHAIDCKDTEPSGEGSRACEGDSVVSLAAGEQVFRLEW